MPESDLAATWEEVHRRIAKKRGYNPDVTKWTPEQTVDVNDIVRSGYRIFLHPEAIGGPPHQWFFLTPPYDLILPAGEQDVDLPADFGFLVGNLYFVDPALRWSMPLEQKNSAAIMAARQRGFVTQARPTECAVVPSTGPSALRGQRQVLLLYPTPNQAYTVNFRYSILASALSISHPHPYGGAAHAETLIQACLAASEEFNDTPGSATAHFKERLAASIEYDRRVAAQSIDNEDGRLGWRGGYSRNYMFRGGIPMGWATANYTG